MHRIAMCSPIVFLVLLLAACQPVQPVQNEQPIEYGEAEVFVQGAAIPGVMDIDIGPDGHIYAASELADKIMALDAQTGDVLWEMDAGEDVPEAVRIAPDGTPYWTSFYSLNVCKATLTDQDKVCQALPVDTWGLAFAPDGRLFIAADAHVQSLYEVDPALETEPRFVETIGALMAHFNFGPDGKLYVPMVADGKILRVDVDSDPVTVETVAEGLTFPWSVDFGAEGQLYVAVSIDGQTSGVARVDVDTGEWEIVGQVPAGYNSVAVTTDGRILSAMNDDGDIYEILEDGTSQPFTEPGMIAPGGLAVLPRADGGESLFVADWKTLRELDTQTGELLNKWHATWFPGAIYGPRTLAAVGNELLVTSWEDAWSGNAVQVWNPELGEATVTETEFAWVANAIPFQSDIVVVDMQADAPWMVERINGVNMAERHILGEGALQHPLGLVASEADLWVADYATGKVLQLIKDSQELAEPTVLTDVLDRPEGMALAADGRLLVAETGTGKLLAIDPTSGDIDVIAEGLGFAAENFGSIGPVSLPAQLVFSGVAVAPSGDIFVSGDAANIIYRILRK
ncbi:MAG: hypothetical protein ACK2UO_07600 [Caldilineaceae bacterium]